jgi:hypothetical protein
MTQPALTPQERGVIKICSNYGEATFDAGPDVNVRKLVDSYGLTITSPVDAEGNPLRGKPVTLIPKPAV